MFTLTFTKSGSTYNVPASLSVDDACIGNCAYLGGTSASYYTANVDSGSVGLVGQRKIQTYTLDFGDLSCGFEKCSEMTLTRFSMAARGPSPIGATCRQFTSQVTLFAMEGVTRGAAISGGAIAGIVVGSIAFIVLVSIIVGCCCCRKSKKPPPPHSNWTISSPTPAPATTPASFAHLLSAKRADDATAGTKSASMAFLYRKKDEASSSSSSSSGSGGKKAAKGGVTASALTAVKLKRVGSKKNTSKATKATSARALGKKKASARPSSSDSSSEEAPQIDLFASKIRELDSSSENSQVRRIKAKAASKSSYEDAPQIDLFASNIKELDSSSSEPDAAPREKIVVATLKPSNHDEASEDEIVEHEDPNVLRQFESPTGIVSRLQLGSESSNVEQFHLQANTDADTRSSKAQETPKRHSEESDSDNKEEAKAVLTVTECLSCGSASLNAGTALPRRRVTLSVLTTPFVQF